MNKENIEIIVIKENVETKYTLSVYKKKSWLQTERESNVVQNKKVQPKSNNLQQKTMSNVVSSKIVERRRNNLQPFFIRGKIESDVLFLNKLHSTYSFLEWIPYQSTMRPTKLNLAKKIKNGEEISNEWSKSTTGTKSNSLINQGLRNYILHTEFGKEIKKEEPRGIYVENQNINYKAVFRPNKYPYQISGSHYVLWIGPVPATNTIPVLDDDKITRILEEKISQLSGYNSDTYDFIWYINPKMTVRNIFHVQVFLNWKVTTTTTTTTNINEVFNIRNLLIPLK